jgi:hypothetical protein
MNIISFHIGATDRGPSIFRYKDTLLAQIISQVTDNSLPANDRFCPHNVGMNVLGVEK